MKRALVVVLLVACHSREHEGERNTKGRSEVTIADKPEAAAPKVEIRVRRRPLFIDLNGDGHEDAVVVVDRSGGPYTFAALDALTGKIIWESNAVEHWSDPAWLVGGFLLQPDDSGDMQGYDLKTSNPTWKKHIGERVTDLCESENAGEVRVVLADKRTIIVTLATGEQVPAPKKLPCKALRPNESWKRAPSDGPLRIGEYIGCGTSTSITSSGRTTTPDDCVVRAHVSLDAIDGIDADALYVVKDGFVVIGTHRPGTGYPVVGLLSGRKLTWKSDVPIANPLTAMTGAPESVELGGSELYVAYRVGQAYFVTAFNITTGKRDWHIAFPYATPHLWASNDALYVFAESPANALVAYTTDTGTLRFNIGQ